MLQVKHLHRLTEGSTIAIIKDHLRLIRHSGQASSHWRLLQRINDTGSHKREIWIPIQSYLRQDQADIWLAQLQKNQP